MNIKPIIDKPENRLVKRFMSIEGTEFKGLTSSNSYKVESISYSVSSYTFVTDYSPNLCEDAILVFVNFKDNNIPDNILDYVAPANLKKGPIPGTVLQAFSDYRYKGTLKVYSKEDPTIEDECNLRKLFRDPEEGYDFVCYVTVKPGTRFVLHTSGMYARTAEEQSMSFHTDSSLITLDDVVFTMSTNQRTTYTAVFTAGNTPGTAIVTNTSNFPKIDKRKWVVKVGNDNDYVPVKKIEFSPRSVDELFKGETTVVEAIVSPSNATYKDIDWSVSMSGKIITERLSLTSVRIKAFGAGYSRLIAKSCDYSTTSWLPVFSQEKSTANDEIRISQKTLYLASGESYTLTAEVTHDGVTRPARDGEVGFRSTNSAVAKVGQGGTIRGVVTGISAGTAVIEAWIGDHPSKKDTCIVYVDGGGNDPNPQPDPGPQPEPQPEPEPDVRPVLHVYSVSLSQASLDLREKESINLTASVTDNGVTHTALQNEIVWKTSNSRIATVTRFGRVTTRQLGECEIRAYLKVDSSVYATCKIIVEQSSAEDESHGGSTSPVVVVQNCLSFLLQKVKSTFSILLRRSFSSISSTITNVGEHPSASITKVVSNLSCSVIKKSGKLSFTTKKTSSKLQCTIGLVCNVSIGAPFGTRILWVSDGMLLTVDGGNFYIEKE